MSLRLVLILNWFGFDFAGNDGKHPKYGSKGEDFCKQRIRRPQGSTPWGT